MSTITITVDDGTETTDETFLLTVAENTPPTIRSIDDQEILQGTQSSVLPFAIGEAESPAGSLSVSAASSNSRVVEGGDIALSGSGADWTVQVTPQPGEFGMSTITITVDDGTETTDETFLLTVTENTPPTITSIDDQEILQGTQTSVLPFTIGDAETPAGSLTVSAASTNTTLVEVGDIALSGSGADWTVQVTPQPGEFGMSTITITVDDGTETTDETFLLTVNAPNTPPTISSIDDQEILQGTQTSVLPFTIGDAETPAGSLTVSAASSNTTLVEVGDIALSGSGADWTVQVTPQPGQTGMATITISVNDGEDIGQETFLLTVTPNTPPTISAISNTSTNEDTPTGTIAFTINDLETPLSALTLAGTSSNIGLVSNSNIVFAGTDGARTVVLTPTLNQSGSTMITLTVGDGVATAQTTFQLTVDPVNDIPTITSIGNQSVLEDMPTAVLNFTIADVETAASALVVTGNSSDISVVALTGIALSGTGGSRMVQITPSPNASGTSLITLTVSDGAGSSQTSFTVMVTAVNDGPTISAIGDQIIDENTETGLLNFTINDIETSPALLTLTPVSSNTMLVPAGNVQLGGTGSMRNVNVIPAINQFGMTTITLTVSDGSLTAQSAFLVTVNNLDAPPTISFIADQNINEDTSTPVINFTIDDPDTGTIGLMVSATSSDQGLIPDGNITLGGTDGNRTIQVTPLANQNGTATITITVNDGVEFTDITFDVIVAPINDAPSFTKGSDPVANEDAGTQTLAGWATSPDDGDAEVSQTLSFNIISNTNAGLFSIGPAISSGGTLTFTPAANTSGNATITISLSDNGSGTPPNVNTSPTQQFIITIDPVNDPPVFTKGSDITVDENDGAQSFPSWATSIGDGDAEFTQTVAFNVSNDDNSLFAVQPSIAPNGNLTFTLAADVSGSTTVSVSLTDDGSGTPPNVNTSAVETFTITVNNINSPPSFTKGADQTDAEDAGLQTVANWATNIDDGDADANQNLTFLVSNDNTTLFSLQPSINPTTGTLTYQPALNANGSATVTVSLRDDGASAPPPNANTSAAQTFEITVTAVNDVPVFAKGADQAVNENSGGPGRRRSCWWRWAWRSPPCCGACSRWCSASRN
jgi:hypothetical protein